MATTIKKSAVNDLLSAPGVPTSTATGSPSISQAIPGLEDMSRTASGNISELLSGLPSASRARTQNAYWGAGAGQPGGGELGTFIGNRGADLYHQESQKYQQQGLDNLLKMIGGYSGTVASTPGQIQQGNQFDQSLAHQKATDMWNQLFQEKKFASDAKMQQQQLDQSKPWWMRTDGQSGTSVSYDPTIGRGSIGFGDFKYS